MWHKGQVIVWCVVFLLPGMAAALESACGLDTRLSAGQIGRVLPGAANNIRAQPEATAGQVGRLPGGHYFTALDGSACEGGFTWREVEYGSTEALRRGWTVESSASEYFLEPSPYAGIPFSGRGVSLVVPAGLGQGAAGSFVQADSSATSGQMFIPASVEIALTGDYPDTDYDDFYAPRIEVYRADAYDGVERGPDYIVGMFEGEFVSTVDGLATILEARPDLAAFNSTSNRLPDLAPNVAHGALAYLDYHDFQNGSGYRFVTFYQQNFWYPENNRLLYRYDGLTAGGRYLVVATLPVDAPRLPEPYDDSAGADDADYGFARYQQYVDGVNAFLTAIPPDEWIPNLDWLDALVASLVVDAIPALESD